MTRLLTLGCALLALAASVVALSQAGANRVAFVERGSALILAPGDLPAR